jgi:fibronectin type 3 domain-containing protein
MSWLSPRAVRRHRRPSRGFRPNLTHLEARVNPVNITVYHNDQYSTGVNNNETVLTRSNVNVNSFGLLVQVPVTGEVYAQPLVLQGVNITTGSNQGMHNVVFVTTEADQVYAIDSDANSPTILWHRSLLAPGATDPAGTIYNTSDLLAGYSTVTTVPYTDVTPNGDITPEVGNTSTPVIDTNTGTIYVEAKSKETVSGTAHYVQRLYALNIQNGNDQTAPFLLGDTTISGSTFVNYASESGDPNKATDQIWVYGNGTPGNALNNDHVVDSYYGTGQNVVQFNAMRQLQRPGLVEVNGSIYIAWASHGDNQPYHGWVAGISAYTPASPTLKLTGVLNTTPNGGLGGVWMAGGQLTFDGTYFYFETGNGTFDGNNGSSGSGNDPAAPAPGPITGINNDGFPVSGDYADSFLKVALQPFDATHPTEPGGSPQYQNVVNGTTTAAVNPVTGQPIVGNGWGLSIVDYFTPYNQLWLTNGDHDVGSSATVIVPDYIPGGPANQFASAAMPRLLIGSGKEGVIYLMNRDNMGKYGLTNNIVENSGIVLNGSLDSAALFNGRMYYVPGYNTKPALAFNFSNGSFNTTPDSQSPDTFAFAGSTPSISANNGTNGIVWDVDRGTNQLRAYSSDSYATELYNSAQAPNNRDTLGPAVKFQVVTIANGRVFVGAGSTGSDYLASNGGKQNGDVLDIYGLLPPPTGAPTSPINLLAQPSSNTQITVSWTDTSTSPNNASGFYVERSTDGGMTWTQIANVSTSSYADTTVATGTTYSYRVRAYDSLGNSGYSNVSAASTPTIPPHTINYSGGFTIANTTPGASQGGLQFNGTTQANMIVTTPGAYLRLTSGAGSQARSAYWTYPNDPSGHAGKMYIPSFTTTFTYLLNGTQGNTADGATFVIQNDSRGITALGGNGGSLGYSTANQITPSFALGINVYNGHSLGTEILTNGNDDFNYTEQNIQTNLVNSPITVTIGYAAGVVTVTEQQTINSVVQTDTKTLAINIPALLGTDYAYVGFTGGTGGISSTQYIENWTFDQGVAPAAPTGLQAMVTGYQGTSATAVPLGAHLTWNAVTDTPAAGGTVSYKVLRSLNAAGPYAQIGTSATTSFDDSGLATGTTYYYEVTATDTYSDSVPSANASITTPMLPPTPTNSQINSITPTSFSFQWQDNANNENGYLILRQAGTNGFQFYTTLPPDTNPAPSIMTFTDTGLTPGVHYDYHVESYNLAGYSDFAGVSGTTPSTVPTNLQATAANAAIQLSWTAGNGAMSYNVYRGTSMNGEGATPIATGVSGTNYTDSSAAYNTTYYYKVTAVNTGGESGPSNEANAFFAGPPTIANGGPQINDGSAQRSEVRSITITFSGLVSFTGGSTAAAFQLQHIQNGANVILNAATSVDAQNRTVVILTFSNTNASTEVDPISELNGYTANPSLADGRYQLTILGSHVLGADGVALDGAGNGMAGSNYVSPADTYLGSGIHLYRLFADVNGDGVVDATDVGQLKSTFNRNNTDPLYLAFLDANNDGVVDAQDVGQFKSRFNANIFN